jgi:hypothetical protein
MPEAPADLDSAIQAFSTDPMYVVAMVEAAGLIIHKQKIWKARRAASASRSDTSHTSSRTTA